MPRRLKSPQKPQVSGGDFVGQGVYGCVFSPPVPTLDHKNFEHNMLGKVMDEKYARMEFDRIKEFKRIDPNEKYGIYGSDPEKVDAKQFIPGAGGFAEASKCKHGLYLKDFNLHKAYQISQVRARGSLDSLVYHPEFSKSNFLNLWQSSNLPNLFRGLASYHRAGLVHLDIKEQNIVFFGYNEVVEGKSTTVASKFAFIDFGLSEKLSTLNVYSPDAKLDVAYFVYPVLANLLFHKAKDGYTIAHPDFNTVTSYLSSSKTIDFLRGKFDQSFFKRNWNPKIVFNPVQDYYNFLKAYKLSKTEKNVRIKMAIATDIFSLGLLVCYAVYTATGMVYNDQLISFDFNTGSISMSTTQVLARTLHSMFHFKESSLATMLRSILSRV